MLALVGRDAGAGVVHQEADRFPIALDGETVTVTASIGVAVAEPGESVDEALRRADAALYDAKRAGAGQVRPALSVAS